MAVHTACNKIDLVPVAILFIVNYYTKYHIVLSMIMIKIFLVSKKTGKKLYNHLKSYIFLTIKAVDPFYLVSGYVRKSGFFIRIKFAKKDSEITDMSPLYNIAYRIYIYSHKTV